MQVTVQNENTVVVDVQQQETIVVEVDQGRAGRGIQNITYTEVSGQYFLIVTYTDGTTETLGPLVVTGGAAFLLGGATGSIPYQSAPNTTVFLPIGTQNQVVVAGATAPQYTSALTGLTVNNSAIGNTAPSTGAFTNLSASGTFALTGDQVQISEGGTGQTTANGAFNALAPSQTGNAGKYLKTDGTNSSWDQLDISTADITGTLPIANGGTGQTTANSALNALLPTQAAQSGKYLKTDGTNASWDQLDISTADITGVLPIANGGTGASTAPGARANLSAAILGTNNDITSMTGLTGGISTPDFVQFDTTATEANAVGKVYWDASQGTLDLGLLGGNVITRIGQTLVAYVTNAEAVTITKGQVVYLFGAQGDRATVKLAYNTSDATSAKTFGVVAENIGPNQTGFVMCQGVLEGLNLGAFTAGDTLYLGATPGSLTATKPAAPNHLVYVGLVERANPGNGQLYVKVQNGYELDEIHDVQIINPQNGQTILYDASTSLWKNANLTAGTGISVTNGAASVTISNTGVLSFSGGTTGLTPATSTTGAVTLGGTLAVASGGTGATTAGGALTNLGAASSAITISAGTGLTGGGDLTANRTLSIANTTVTAASYGSASSVGTFTVNAQGQLTAAASTPIAIANTQVSGLGTMSTQNSNSVTITGGSITGITDLAIADGGTGASDAPTARTNLGLGTSAVLNAGVALGVATLDAGGTVPLSQLPASIQGGVSYQGSWDAATNTPTIVSSVGTKGYYYVVSVAGSTNINGISDWLPGDWIIFNGSIWQKIDNTDAVASVNGYTGVVVLSAADVGAAPTSRTITAGTGLTGGGDLSANRTISIANTTVAAGSYGSASSVGTFTVNGQGQLTAAASTPIAITNTQVSGLGTMSTQNAGSVAITGGTIDGTTIGGTTRAAGSFTTLTLTNALSVANGGTGTTTSTGTGSVVLSSSPTLTTPNLGTPSAVTLTNATGLPLTTGVTGTLPIGNGGTGQTTANAAFNALAPSQTGNAGKYLTTDGTNTSWATNPLGTVTSVDVSGGTTGLTTSGGPITSSGTITLGGTLGVANGGTGTTTAFTAGSVVFAGASGVYSQNNSQLFWDNTNTRLGIGTSSPAYKLDVNGAAQLASGSAGGLLNYNYGVSASSRQWRLWNDVLANGDFAISQSTTRTGTTFDAKLYFDASGNLGIGTSSPSVKLDVFGRAKIDVGTYASGYALTLGAISETSRTYQIGMVTGGSLAIYDSAAAAQRVVLDTSGRLLIGYTTSQASGSNLQVNTDAYIYGITVGRGAGAVATNTAVGASALAANTTGAFNSAIGTSALAANTTGSYNTALGRTALTTNTTGGENTAIGANALQVNTTGSNNIAVGGYSLVTNSTGNFNTAVGWGSLWFNTTASNNTAVGYQAAYSNTTGVGVVAVGRQALYSHTTGSRNTGVGDQALYNTTTAVDNAGFGTYALLSNSTGAYNTAVGSAALFSNTTSSYNTAVGYQAGYFNTAGIGLVAIGSQAGFANTTGNNNVSLGVQAGYANTTGYSNTMIGHGAGAANTSNGVTYVGAFVGRLATGAGNCGFGGGDTNSILPTLYSLTSGYFNTAVGLGAMGSTTTGIENTAVGYRSLYLNTTGSFNVAIGRDALIQNTTASSNTAIGYAALGGTTTGGVNTAVGQSALVANTTGTENVAVGSRAAETSTTASDVTAVGFRAARANTVGSTTAFGAYALDANTSGLYNTAVGLSALASNTTASNNTAVGYLAGYNNTTATQNVYLGTQAGYTGGADRTVAIGYQTLYYNTGDRNTAVGWQAMVVNTSGGYNIAVGHTSLTANTTGSYNTALGYESLRSNTTANNNTAVGYQAGYSNQTGFGNTYIGQNSGAAATSSINTFVGASAGAAVTTGERNTLIGHSAGFGLSTGSNNTFIGVSATSASGALITTGSKNTILGGYNGNQGGLDIRTANNYIVLSDGDGNPRMYANGAAWTNPGSMSVGGMTAYTSYSQSFSLGTTQWIRLCQLGNPGSMRIKYFLGSSNSEEYGEVFINATYIASGNQITVDRQSYNSNLLEVRLVTSSSGLPYDVFFNIRSNQFAPYINWTPFDVRANGFTVYNDTTSPGAASSSLVLETGAATASNISATNGLFGAYGGGVQFPATQVASANANTLDDYEEGTWTPQITDTVNNATMGASNSGTYTKIGRVVTCQMYVQVTSLGSIGSSNAVYITGWPFTIGNNGGGSLSDASGLNITAGRVLTLRPWSGNLMRFYIWDATTGTSPIIASQWTASGAAFISVTYTV